MTLTIIAIIAVLNLCLGYLLGASIGVLPSWLEAWLPEGSLSDGDSLDYLADADAEAWQEEISQPATKRTPAAAKRPEAVAEPTRKARTQPPDMLRNKAMLGQLAMFKQRLAQVNAELNKPDAPREEVEHQAQDLKQANQQYIDDTQEMTLEMSEDEEAQKLQAKILEQHQQLRRENIDIDQWLEEEDTEQMRQKLLASSEKIGQSAAVIEQDLATDQQQRAAAAGIEPSEEETTAAATVGQPPATTTSDKALASEKTTTTDKKATPDKKTAVEREAAVDQTPVPGTIQKEELLGAIESHLLSHAKGQPLQLAVVTLDATSEQVSQHADRLLKGLVKLVKQSLRDGQQVVVDQGRVLLMLPEDDVMTATRRLEEVRNRVAVTHFLCDGEEIETTVSCSVADTSQVDQSEELLVRLEETLQEARRNGSNQTFHHDGKFPAPVIPQTFKIPPAQLEV